VHEFVEPRFGWLDNSWHVDFWLSDSCCCDSGRAKSIKALDALMILSEAANAKPRFVKSLTTASTAWTLGCIRHRSAISSPIARPITCGALHNMFASVAPACRMGSSLPLRTLSVPNA
jgi:hypothetical protein